MDRLMTIPEYADRLGVPQSWVREKVAARAISFTKVGKHVRFSEDHFRALVAEGEQLAVTTPPRLTVVRRLA